jgi:inosine triphosphate pyrophosphatase
MTYFITGNQNKLAEAKTILGDIEAYGVDLPEIQEIDAHVIIREKLKEALKHKDGEFIVEDTSLYFEALNGLPGPLIKWFMKTIGNDGLYNLATKLGNNNATAKTLIGYAKNPDEIEFFEGVIEGIIVEPSGGTNFGWDPIFKPNGYERTFAQMGASEKNLISMRKIALEKLRDYLGMHKP